MKLKSYIAALHAALFAILLAVSPAGSGSMTLLGAGKAAGGGGPFSINWIATPAPQASGTTSTFTVNLGAGTAGRIIVVCAVANGLTATGVITGAKLNSVSMNTAVIATAANGQRQTAMFYLVDATSNASTPIEIDASNSLNGNAIVVYSITGALSSTPTGGAGVSETYGYVADPQLTSSPLTVNSGGGAIACALSENTVLTPTWSNMTVDSRVTGAGLQVGSGSTTTSGTLTPSVTGTSGQGWGMVAGSWQ